MTIDLASLRLFQSLIITETQWMLERLEEYKHEHADLHANFGRAQTLLSDLDNMAGHELPQEIRRLERAAASSTTPGNSKLDPTGSTSFVQQILKTLNERVFAINTLIREIDASPGGKQLSMLLMAGTTQVLPAIDALHDCFAPPLEPPASDPAPTKTLKRPRR